jgi:phosphodiesterase/alkaline phosphatase D-like protein
MLRWGVRDRFVDVGVMLSGIYSFEYSLETVRTRAAFIQWSSVAEERLQRKSTINRRIATGPLAFLYLLPRKQDRRPTTAIFGPPNPLSEAHPGG